MLLQLPTMDWQLYYNVITIAHHWLTITSQCYYNCPQFIDNPITIAHNSMTIVLQLYHNSQGLINNCITMLLQLPTIYWQ
jgi:hypothetical protein